MKGLGLLVVFASLGADAAFEKGPRGTPRYTIRVDLTALGPLREGKDAFQTIVRPGDRGFRDFQVIVADADSRTPDLSQRSGMPDDTIKYGWEPAGEGGVKFFIQMTPERFGHFEDGIPVRGQVPIGITDVREVLVFVGTQDLPQPPIPNHTSSPPPSPDFQQLDSRIAQTQSVSDDDSVMVVNSQRESSISPGRDGSYSSPRNSGFTASQTSSVSARRDPLERQTATAALDSTGRYRQQSLTDPTSAQPTDYARTRQDLDDRRWQNPNYRRSASDLNQPMERVDRDVRTRMERGGARDYRRDDFERGYTGRGYDDTGYMERADYTRGYSDRGYRDAVSGYERYQTQLAEYRNAPLLPPANARRPVIDERFATQQPPTRQTTYTGPAANAGAAFTATETTPPSAAPSTGSATPTTRSASGSTFQAEEGEVHPWGPLILTTMALFTSLGANAYLGWLAWSFFWRFRDVANDVVRARNQSSTARQAA